MVIKSFKNKLGYVTIEKTGDGKYIVSMRSEFARVSHLLEYKYRPDAIASFQFYCFWLNDNEKNVKNTEVATCV